jgi:2'-5' RNA ligase
MRLFVGTLLSPSTQAFYDRFIKDLVHEHPEALRSIPEGSAHLTYAFCADADAGAVDAVLGAAKQTAGAHDAFEIGLGSPHVVFAGARPRLVCAEILRGQPELRRLTADLLGSLHLACPGLSLSPSRTPHVTLARFRKQARRSDGQAVSRSLTAGAGASAHDQIAQVQLVASTLTPSGPVYEIRAQAPLKRPS